MGLSMDDMGNGTLGRAALRTVHVSVARDFMPFPASEDCEVNSMYSAFPTYY